MNEQFLPCATYDRDMNIVPDEPEMRVPCAVWDPDRPEGNVTKFSQLSQPAKVRLNPGDMVSASYVDPALCVPEQRSK